MIISITINNFLMETSEGENAYSHIVLVDVEPRKLAYNCFDITKTLDGVMLVKINGEEREIDFSHFTPDDISTNYSLDDLYKMTLEHLSNDDIHDMDDYDFLTYIAKNGTQEQMSSINDPMWLDSHPNLNNENLLIALTVRNPMYLVQYMIYIADLFGEKDKKVISGEITHNNEKIRIEFESSAYLLMSDSSSAIGQKIARIINLLKAESEDLCKTVGCLLKEHQNPMYVVFEKGGPLSKDQIFQQLVDQLKNNNEMFQETLNKMAEDSKKKKQANDEREAKERKERIKQNEKMVMKNMSSYEILGVKRNATKKEIKEQYRKLAREHHPDYTNDEISEIKMKKINAAYEDLMK